MKNLLSLMLIVLVSGSIGYSQTRTFDIMTYRPPSGWSRSDKDGARIYNILENAKGIYGLIGIYPSAKSSGNALKDFNASWNSLVMPVFGTGPAPVPSPLRKVDGYDELSGSSFGKSQGKQTTVRLVNFTGGGKTLSIIINYSDFKFEEAVDKFLKSIKLNGLDTASVKKD